MAKSSLNNKRKMLKNPKRIEDLKDANGNLIEYAWIWCRTLAFGTRVKYWRDYPEADDLESIGIIKGIELIKNEKGIEVRNPRNFVMKGMRNSMRNYIYHRTKSNNRFKDEEGKNILLDNVVNIPVINTNNFNVKEDVLVSQINKVLNDFKKVGRDFSKYFDFIKKYSLLIANNGYDVYHDKIQIPPELSMRDLNRLISLVFWNLK